MKQIKYFFLACLMAAVAAACGKSVVAELSVLFSTVEVVAGGGSQDVSFKSNLDWNIHSNAPWLTVQPQSGAAVDGYQKVTITAEPNPDETARTATLTVAAGGKSVTMTVNQAGKPAVQRATIQEFRNKQADKTTWYELTGEIVGIANDSYGNFYLADDTGFVYVYGLCEKQVESNDQSFQKLDLKVGDKLTMMTLRSQYNDTVEAGGAVPAYFVTKTPGEYKLGTKVPATQAGWLELPATSADDGQDLLIHRFPGGSRSYAAYYDYENLVSTWVAYPLCKGNIGSGTRTADAAFPMDPLLPREKQAVLANGFKEGNAGKYDRGHQIASADRLDWRVNLETFFSTNMTPQLNALNAEGWATLETKVRDWAAKSDTLYVVTGCSVAGSDNYALDNEGKKVTVPTGYYKALLRLDGDKGYMGLGIWMNHAANSATGIKPEMVISIDELEKKVGVDFFVNLPAEVQESVEAQNPADVAWWWNN